MKFLHNIKSHKHEIKRKAERRLMKKMGWNTPEWSARKARLAKKQLSTKRKLDLS